MPIYPMKNCPAQPDTAADPRRRRLAYAAARMPSTSRLILLAAVLFAGLVSLSQNIVFGPYTGLGVMTMLTCGGAWLLWLSKPRIGREHLPVVLPLLMFGIYSCGSLIWAKPDTQAYQQLCVMLGFSGLILLAAREVEDDPTFAVWLHRAVDVATWFATALYSVSLLRDGLGAETIILARPYALFVLIGLARQLALWRSGDKRGLLGASIILAVVLASISRTALAAALLLVPLAALVRGRKSDFGFAIGSAVLGAAAVGAALALNPRIYERFFGYDANIEVGGVAINGSGRMEIWQKLWESATETPWLGHGVASASQRIGYLFPTPGIGHPHNDYLRFFHDFGLLGLSLWLMFQIGAMITLFIRAREASRSGKSDPGYHLVPLLGFVALTISMMTDNAVCYSFVMAPLAVMLGCSLGISAGERQKTAAPMFREAQRETLGATWRRRRRAAAAMRRQPITTVESPSL